MDMGPAWFLKTQRAHDAMLMGIRAVTRILSCKGLPCSLASNQTSPPYIPGQLYLSDSDLSSSGGGLNVPLGAGRKHSLLNLPSFPFSTARSHLPTAKPSSTSIVNELTDKLLPPSSPHP